MAPRSTAQPQVGVSFSTDGIAAETRQQYMKLPTVRRDELINELEAIYVGLFQVFSRQILDERVLAAYGMPDWHEDITREHLPDLHELHGADQVLAFHHYAINGVAPNAIWDFIYNIEDIEAFIAQALASSHANADVPWPIRSLRVFDTARARLSLDLEAGAFTDINDGLSCSPYLSLFEVALLAGMSERSVRNATLASARDRLQTEREGHYTVVAPHEALRWLRGRRGFIETRFDDAEAAS
jgi:hypothetical protein